MEITLNQDALKAQARRMKAALREQGIEAKLSQVYEVLAQTYGYRNLATLHAKLKEEAGRYVENSDALVGGHRWVMLFDYFDSDEEEWGLLPYGTTLQDVASVDWTAVATLVEAALPFPAGVVLGPDTTVLGTYVEGPSFDKYGVPAAADEGKAAEWVTEELGFRVLTRGFDVCGHDRRDDGGEATFIEVWMTEDDHQRCLAFMTGSDSAD